jgi:HEPN domain-containing protein
MVKAKARRRVLEVLAEEQAWSDVVREAQELVELALKGALRVVGVDPPKWHDVGPILRRHRPGAHRNVRRAGRRPRHR